MRQPPVSVAFVANGGMIGGAERSFELLVGGIRAFDVNPYILTYGDGAATQSLRNLGENPHPLLPEWRRRNVLFYLRRHLRIARDLRGQKVALIHVNLHLSGAAHGWLLAKLLRVPLIVHVRNLVEPGWYVQKNRRFLSSAARLICITCAVEDSVKSSGLTAPTTVIYNGVDLERFVHNPATGQRFRQSVGLPATGFVFGLVGQIQPEKGIVEFVEAAQIVAQNNPAAHFAVIGDWEQAARQRPDYVAAIEAAVQNKALDARLHRVPFQTEVAPVYSGLNCLVLASWAEPMGRVLIEAMAARLPVIATDAGGAPEVVRGDAGTLYAILVPPREPEALARAMQDILLAQGSRELQTRQERAYEQTRQRFSAATHCAQIAALYHDVWSGHRKAR